MNMELKETCENLKELSQALKVKKECEIHLGKTEEQYIIENLEIKKPKLEEIISIEEPIKPKERKGTVYLLIIMAFLSMIILPFFSTNIILTLVLALVCFFGFIFFSGVVNSKIIKYEKKLKEYDETMQQNLKNAKQNERYPTLLGEYNKLLSECKRSYQTIVFTSKEKLAEANQIIEKNSGIINPKFYEEINEIIAIIEDGRADSLKEAINLFVSDSRQKDLVKAQQESNRIAEQQMWDARRHNREMEEQARRQADAVKHQEDARRRGAPNCWQCKNYPCGGDPAYCGSFAKRE